jgi:mono/diheme cytochrome c family protein
MLRRGSKKTARASRVAMMTSTAVWAAGFGLMVVAHGGQPAAAGLQSALKDGVYTDAQAARGKALYQAQCSNCHLDTLNGTPPLAGEAFRAKWAALTVNDLFTKMRETMPTTEPGMLAPAEYVDVIAYILKENKFPAGAQELKDDAEALKRLTLGGG